MIKKSIKIFNIVNAWDNLDILFEFLKEFFKVLGITEIWLLKISVSEEIKMTRKNFPLPNLSGNSSLFFVLEKTRFDHSEELRMDKMFNLVNTTISLLVIFQKIDKKGRKYTVLLLLSDLYSNRLDVFCCQPIKSSQLITWW